MIKNIRKILFSIVVLFVAVIFSKDFDNLGIIYISLLIIYMLRYNRLRKEKL